MTSCDSSHVRSWLSSQFEKTKSFASSNFFEALAEAYAAWEDRTLYAEERVDAAPAAPDETEV